MIPLEYYIYNHICIEWDRIDEAHGVPDGLRDDAKYIAAQILEHWELNEYRNFDVEIDVSKLNIKFTKLTCEIVDYSGITSYADIKPNKKYTESTTLTIHLRKQDFKFGKLIPLIGHELLHWYTYVLNGEEEMKSVFLKRISTVNQDALFTDSDTFNEELIKQLIYYTSADEVNAFITELILTIEQESPTSIEEAYKLLFKSDLYTGYIALYNKLIELSEEEVNNTNVNSELHYVFDVYRQLNQHDKKLSNGQILHKLKRRLNQVKDRMIKAVSRALLSRESTRIR